MRQTISGMVAAVAVMMTAGAAPAMASCGGGGLFESSCSPCAQTYASPCAPAPVYVAPVAAYSGCGTGCGGWARERLPDPEQQYYYVNQGPTYTGPGNWAPHPVYREDRVSRWNDGYRPRAYRYGYHSSRYVNEGPAIYRVKRHFRPYRGYSDYRYSARPSVRYGYAPRHGYAPRYGHAPRHSYAPRYSLPPRQFYAPPRSLRYGAPQHHAPRHFARPRSHEHHMMRKMMRHHDRY
jgi:hypothetical protein